MIAVRWDRLTGRSPGSGPARTPHPTPAPTTPGSFQKPGLGLLELKEAFTLFQIQYNRSYSHPAGTGDPWVSGPTPLLPFNKDETRLGGGHGPGCSHPAGQSRA